MSKFFLQHGGTLDTIKDLHAYLPSLPDEVFAHHVTSERNDFHNWIKDVHQDHELATEVLACNSKEELHLTLSQYLDDMKVLHSVAKQLDKASKLVAQAAGLKY